ncbi:kinase-like domain-containing protein, partial [Crucibulum laeve]
MLTDVKKEVDIMRLLKGHPNIVHLIDAAWHKMPNGMHEVFILMEYCPGGGIIDMMNRRLRERLTESEILQIFVDVCEGVAYMHNSRPPLLHRDLKVENILQSSPTSFKLCDFGSATTVSRPPTSTQDIRALEADLNRHTTLQYRAPEMIDVYSKRPIDEKSDIWALGVLLYKLCYYTTPFEEHGPLAILNVQYRTPPYPVYSSQMNGLISLMLKEHGSQRPTVFELLALVHRLRGTKSQFHYDIPAQQPLSQQHQFRPSPPSNALEGTVTYNSSALYQNKVPTMISAPINQGIQAREKVLDAIAPMRRGRPTITDSQPASRSSTPQKSVAGNDKPRTFTNSGFAAEEDKAWRAATAGKDNNELDDAWTIHSADHRKESVKASRPTGFGDDFGEKLWNSSDPNATNSSSLNSRRGPPSSAPVTKTSPSLPVRPLTVKQELLSNNRDAFDGLGLMASGGKPAPTLGEARKLRTG